ncbi:MAG: hypothetical protein MJE77_09340 [Proteobacteria bacterium]|nr:hypothetical protein [Pseudomonadota bacterium]
MRNGLLSRVVLAIAATAVTAAGCSTSNSPDRVGTAKVRIDVADPSNPNNPDGTDSITRVVVRAADGKETELVPDPANGGFVGTMMLPAGDNVLVGQAYSGEVLIGESAPVPVEVQAGHVVGANIRILDLRNSNVGHRPIVVALTYPLSTVANRLTDLSATVVDPDGDPVNLLWSSDCADSQFTDAEAAETQWMKSEQGSCTIALTANDGELSTVDSFRVVVFAEGADTGAVDVDGVFVANPTIYMNLNAESLFCDVFTGAQDGTCFGEIASPTVASLSAHVDWGRAVPGSIEASDNCGGSFELFGEEPFFLSGLWTPPTEQGICLVTVRAISPDGVQSELSAAVLVRDGQAPPPPIGPQITADFFHSKGSCHLPLEATAVDCPTMLLGDLGSLEAHIDWAGRQPGFVDVFDTCGGEFTFIDNNDPFFLRAEWLAQQPGDCEIHIQAVSPDGSGSSEAILRFPVDGGDPPPPPAGAQISADFSYGNGSCHLPFGESEVECPEMLLGDLSILDARIEWANEPGTVQVFDTCGGEFTVLDNSNPYSVYAEWFSRQPGDCKIHILAEAIDGTIGAEAILRFRVL